MRPAFWPMSRCNDERPRSCSDLGPTAVEVRGFEPLTFSMPWRRATNCAIPPLAGSILPSRSRDAKSVEGDAEHSAQTAARGVGGGQPSASDDGSDVTEIANCITFALFAYPLFSSERAHTLAAALLNQLAALLRGGCRSARPADQTQSGAQRQTTWKGEWKCRRQNDSFVFSGRRYPKSGRAYPQMTISERIPLEYPAGIFSRKKYATNERSVTLLPQLFAHRHTRATAAHRN